MTTAAELMTEHPVTIRPTARLRDAVRLLEASQIRHLPVVDEGGRLVGIMSDRDLRPATMPLFFATEYLATVQTALDAEVASVMTADPVSVTPDDDAERVIDLMLENKIGAVPVTDARGAVVGIVSYVDVLREIPIE